MLEAAVAFPAAGGPAGSAAMPDPPEAVEFGDYLLEREIAHGGMGVVYRARQRSLGRTVAVKLLLLGRHASQESIQRFHREARSAAALRHPHIVAIHEVGECEGQQFFSMEYVEGPNLAELVRTGPLAPREAVEHTCTIAEAIQYAHSQGVLHRDLKPSNILVDPFGKLRVTDFGLAKRLDGSSDLTESGRLLGTPHYLSPEAAAGRTTEIGPASDLYAIGAVFYELLTGRPPFLAPSVSETLLRIRDAEPVSPRRLNPAVPEDVETICLKCLDKKPANRYPDAAGLAEDLGRWLRHEPITARPVTAWEQGFKWVRRNPAVAGLIATVGASLLAVTLGVLWFSVRVDRARRQTEAANQRLARNLFVREWQDAEQLIDGGQLGPALAWFARVVRRDPADAVAATRLVSLLGGPAFPLPAAPPLAHGSPVHSAGFSPDGTRVVTAAADGEVRVWSPAGAAGDAAPQVLPRRFAAPTAAFVPDGRVLVAEAHSVSLWEADGRRVTEVAAPTGGKLRWSLGADGRRAVLESSAQPPQLWELAPLRRLGVLPYGSPGQFAAPVSPHGRHVLRSFSTPGVEGWQVGAWELGTGRRVWQVALGGGPLYLAMYSGAVSAGGTQVAISRWGGTVEVRDFKPLATGEMTAPVPEAPRFRFELGAYVQAEVIRFLDQDRRLLVGGTDGAVLVYDLRTGERLPERIEHQGAVAALEVAPDGLTVVSASVDGIAGLWDFRMRQPAPLVLTNRHEVWDARFAPDGSWFVQAGGPPAEVRDTRTGALRHVLPGAHPLNRVAVSGDGRRIATTSEKGVVQVWNARTGAAVTPPIQVDVSLQDVAFSPDGRWFLTGPPMDRVAVFETETGRPAFPPLLAGSEVVRAAFAPDGRTLAVVTIQGDVQFWSLPEGTRRAAASRHKGVVWDARFSQDGRLLATASTDQTAVVWDVATGRALREFRQEKPIYVATLSADGRHLLVGGADQTARVWDVATGRPLSEPMRHPGGVWFSEFDPAGRFVVTGDDSGMARLWDAATGLPLSGWLASSRSLRRLRVAPDGGRILTCSSDQTVKLWSVVLAPTPAPAWLPELAEAFAGRRLTAEGAIERFPFPRWQALRAELERAPGDDFYARWVRWLLVERREAEQPTEFTPGP